MKTIKSRAMILGVAAVALSLSTATTVGAAHPFDLDVQQRAVEKVAPPFPTLPGKRLCVCQDTHAGYLNSITSQHGVDVEVAVVCAYTEFDPVTNLPVGASTCDLFTEIK